MIVRDADFESAESRKRNTQLITPLSNLCLFASHTGTKRLEKARRNFALPCRQAIRKLKFQN